MCKDVEKLLLLIILWSISLPFLLLISWGLIMWVSKYLIELFLFWYSCSFNSPSSNFKTHPLSGWSWIGEEASGDQKIKYTSKLSQTKSNFFKYP